MYNVVKEMIEKMGYKVSIWLLSYEVGNFDP